MDQMMYYLDICSQSISLCWYIFWASRHIIVIRKQKIVDYGNIQTTVISACTVVSTIFVNQ